MMRAAVDGLAFARGICLPLRALLPGGEGNWRGAVPSRPFYSNTMTHGRALRVAPDRGKLSATGSTATAYCWLIWDLARPEGLGVTQFGWIGPCRKRLERAGDYQGVA